MHVGQNFIDSFPERVVRSQLIPMMNKAKRLGEKTGRGFYVYKNRKPEPDPSVQEIIAASRAASGLEKVRSTHSTHSKLRDPLLPTHVDGCRCGCEAAHAGVVAVLAGTVWPRSACPWAMLRGPS